MIQNSSYILMDLSEFQGQGTIFVDANCKILSNVIYFIPRPNFMKWAESKMGVDKSMTTPP